MAPLFTIIAQNWKQPRLFSVGEELNKLWYANTMEYYLAIKRNRPEIYATTWINLQRIMPSKKEQFQEIT